MTTTDTRERRTDALTAARRKDSAAKTTRSLTLHPLDDARMGQMPGLAFDDIRRCAFRDRGRRPIGQEVGTERRQTTPMD